MTALNWYDIASSSTASEVFSNEMNFYYVHEFNKQTF